MRSRVGSGDPPQDRRARCAFALAFSYANVHQAWATGSGRLALGGLIGALKEGPYARRFKQPLTELRPRKGFSCAVHPVGYRLRPTTHWEAHSPGPGGPT
mgnify:CR=1 FL=1